MRIRIYIAHYKCIAKAINLYPPYRILNIFAVKLQMEYFTFLSSLSGHGTYTYMNINGSTFSHKIVVHLNLHFWTVCANKAIVLCAYFRQPDPRYNEHELINIICMYIITLLFIHIAEEFNLNVCCIEIHNYTSHILKKI